MGPSQKEPKFAADEVFLGAHKPEDLSDVKSYAKSKGGKIKREFAEVNSILVELPEKVIDAFTKEAKGRKTVKYVERNFVANLTLTPNDSLWDQQWSFRKILADSAWDVQRGKTGVIVAVIDTGIDYTHPDLAANYLAGGYDWYNNDANPMDDHYHGTHVAGTVAAATGNVEGVAGLASVKVVAEKFLGASGSGYYSGAVNAIIHATGLGAKILSNSWGGSSYSQALYDAFNYAYSRGVLSIAAAGNSASTAKLYPAGFTDIVVSVAATDQNDNKASFSNYGDWIELSAPGVSIISTYPGPRYAFLSGTSMATPHVSGLAALILSQFPTVTRDEVREFLRVGADDLGAAGKDPIYGYGRINAWKTINLLKVRTVGLTSGLYKANFYIDDSLAGPIWDGTTLLFTGYSGTRTASIDQYVTGAANTRFHSQPSTVTVTLGAILTFNFHSEFYLTVDTDPADLVAVGGAGWYDSGSTATTSVAPTTATKLQSTYAFQSWTVDGVTAQGNPASILMDSPHRATARYGVLQTSTISVSGNPTSLGLGSAVQLTGAISPAHQSTVTFTYSLDGGQTWTLFMTTTTDPSGAYSIRWTPPYAASYLIKSSWPGDSDHAEAASSTLSLTVTGTVPVKPSLSIILPKSQVARGETILITLTVFNPTAQPVSNIELLVEIAGPGSYRHVDWATVTLTADPVNRFLMAWTAPSSPAGIFEVRAGFFASTYDSQDAARIRVV